MARKGQKGQPVTSVTFEGDVGHYMTRGASLYSFLTH
jgi:hypothetical protein